MIKCLTADERHKLDIHKFLAAVDLFDRQHKGSNLSLLEVGLL